MLTATRRDDREQRQQRPYLKQMPLTGDYHTILLSEVASSGGKRGEKVNHWKPIINWTSVCAVAIKLQSTETRHQTTTMTPSWRRQRWRQWQLVESTSSLLPWCLNAKRVLSAIKCEVHRRETDRDWLRSTIPTTTVPSEWQDLPVGRKN